jgi:hypothetical protein
MCYIDGKKNKYSVVCHELKVTGPSSRTLQHGFGPVHKKFILGQYNSQYTSLVVTSSSVAYKAGPVQQFCKDFGPNGNSPNYLK